ncbi:MAG TPA: hypothetical protein ENF70_06270 [Deltaproteobacteria bacterium]|nr:hypothetical protein [Deltaproteobacteria bacterium]
MKIRSTPTIIVNLVLFIFFGLSISAFADSMKIAVAATGPEKDAAISQQAGRTPFFLFFNDKGNFLEAVENPSRDRSRNAGPNAALFLADKGVTLVIAGNIGNKMEQALRDDQIEYIEKTGAAYDVVQTIIQDR